MHLQKKEEDEDENGAPLGDNDRRVGGGGGGRGEIVSEIWEYLMVKWDSRERERRYWKFWWVGGANYCIKQYMIRDVYIRGIFVHQHLSFSLK